MAAYEPQVTEARNATDTATDGMLNALRLGARKFRIFGRLLFRSLNQVIPHTYSCK